MSQSNPGKDAEDFVKRAGDFLIANWPQNLPRLRRYIVAKVLDISAIDIWFVFEGGLGFHLQIKSSARAAEDHRQSSRGYIPVIVPGKEEKMEGFAGRMMAMMLEAFDTIRATPRVTSTEVDLK